MSIFNDKMLEGMFGGTYTCSQCGGKMEFEDEYGDVLICESCGHSLDYDRYGCESDDEYDALYPTLEEVLAREGKYEEENEVTDDGEDYEEVCGELSKD